MSTDTSNGENDTPGGADRERAQRAADHANRRARNIDRLGCWIIGLAIVLLAIVALCQLDNEAQVQQAYDAAIADAAVAKPSEISKALTPILPGAPGTYWKKSDGISYVLTVTWASWKGYDGAIGSALKLSQDVWITLVPQLAEFCSRLEDVDLNLRLEQRLGLPPYSRKTKFVEMWVEPNDLFRPCPDREIDDNRCTLNFPPKTDVAHIQWIDNQRKTSYSGDTPYPWTRLGYTYDWERSTKEIGLSEYVIRKGATVQIKSVDSTSNYCQC